MGVVFSSYVVPYDPEAVPTPSPTLPLIYSIGSMANGSNHLILSDAAGGTYFRSATPPLRVPFQIGNKIIVEIGGEAGAGARGTMGVGGIVAATTPGGNYPTAEDLPKALVATITNITGGNDLTLDATAFTATTNARIYRDNTDGMNAENSAVAVPGTTVTWPAGTFAQHDYIGGFSVDNCTLQGAGRRRTQLYQPKGALRSGITPGGGRSGLTFQDMTIWGNAKWEGFAINDDSSLFFVGVGVWVFNCFNCIIRRIEAVNVYQKAVWFEAGSGNQAINCNMIQEEALQSYNAQWYMGASDASNCTFDGCNFYGVYLAPAFETFRSTGVQFLNCTTHNGSFSTNSSGNWLIENATITITENSWLNASSFSVTNPGIDINSNIQPPSADILLGGIVRNFTFTNRGSIDAIGSYLTGVKVGLYTPNIFFDGATFTYPGVDNSATSGGLAYCIYQIQPPTDDIVAQDVTVIGGDLPSYAANLNIWTVPGAGAVINCTGFRIKKNGITLPTGYVGFSDASNTTGIGPVDLAYWGLRAVSAAAIGATAIRLRRDGASPGEQNFVTISTGDLDLTAIAAFLAASAGATGLWCVTLFDQIGTNHMTQATAANQPAFILNGLNSHPILTFDGVNDHLTGSSAISIGPNSVAALVNITSTGGQQAIYTAGSTSFIHTATANQLTINNGTALTASSTGLDASWRMLVAAFTGTTSAKIFVDFSVQIITGDAGSNTGTAVPDIGSGVGFFSGSFIELSVQSGLHTQDTTSSPYCWAQEFYGF